MADEFHKPRLDKLKILLYNFAQPREYKGSGGVGIYLENLLSELTSRGHEVITFSSGLRYTVVNKSVRLVHKDHPNPNTIILNSPNVAPAIDTFYNLEPYLSDKRLSSAALELHEKYGEIDVFHFQNIEGLTLDFFLRLRSVFPNARIIYSAHNYNLVCPQVQLWYQDREACADYREGENCTRCLIGYSRHPRHQATRPIEAALTRRGWSRDDAIVGAARRLTRHVAALSDAVGSRLNGRARTDAVEASVYRSFRTRNVELANHVFDKVIAVSERTQTILMAYGVNASKICVSYIGTAHKTALTTQPRKTDFTSLHLGYLGYAKHDKGFFFLLDALEHLPAEAASRISVTLAAKVKDVDVLSRVQRLRSRFESLEFFNGYSHELLEQILAPVNLGIVPVIWEDNLPQVAIELVAYGIPILTSDRGGAQEIASVSDFTFEAGDVSSFCDKIEDVLARKLPLSRFWENPLRIYSMEEHVTELMVHYRESNEGPAALEDDASPASSGLSAGG